MPFTINYTVVIFLFCFGGRHLSSSTPMFDFVIGPKPDHGTWQNYLYKDCEWRKGMMSIGVLLQGAFFKWKML